MTNQNRRTLFLQLLMLAPSVGVLCEGHFWLSISDNVFSVTSFPAMTGSANLTNEFNRSNRNSIDSSTWYLYLVRKYEELKNKERIKIQNVFIKKKWIKQKENDVLWTFFFSFYDTSQKDLLIWTIEEQKPWFFFALLTQWLERVLFLTHTMFDQYLCFSSWQAGSRGPETLLVTFK